MRRVCRGWGVGLGLVLWSAAGVVAGDDPGGKSPEQVLTEAGLTRVGHAYLLEGERQAETLVQDYNQHAARLAAELDREAMVAADQQVKQYQAAMLRQQAQLDRNAAHMMRRNRSVAGAENRQASQLNRQAQSLQRSASTQAGQQLRSLAQAASADQKQMAQDQSKYQALVRETLGRYDQIARQPEVVKALRALNKGRHPKFALGPAGAYRARVKRAMLEQLAERGLQPPRRGVAEPTEAGALVRQAEAFHARFRALAKAEAPSDPAERAALAREAAALREKLASLERRCATLDADADVRDALEELELQTKAKHLHVGLGFEATSALKVLDQVLAAPIPPAAPSGSGSTR